MHVNTVYKTTNLTNQKFYIGVHTCNCNPCHYLGSGKALLAAIDKYGEKAFSKEILATFKHKKDAYLYERTLVDHLDPNCYNLCEGGEGGAKNHIPCMWEGVLYESKAAAARALGVDPSTFNKWYSHKTKPKKPNNFTMAGKDYTTYSEAARDFKVDPTTMRTWVKKGLKVPPKTHIVFGGKSYKNKKQLADELGVSASTVTNLLRDPDRYKGYFMIKGLKFNSQKAASQHYGVWPQTISKWVSNPTKVDCVRVKP